MFIEALLYVRLSEDAKLSETITILKGRDKYMLAHNLHLPSSLLTPANARLIFLRAPWDRQGKEKGHVRRKVKGLLCTFPGFFFVPFGVG